MGLARSSSRVGLRHAELPEGSAGPLRIRRSRCLKRRAPLLNKLAGKMGDRV